MPTKPANRAAAIPRCVLNRVRFVRTSIARSARRQRSLLDAVYVLYTRQNCRDPCLAPRNDIVRPDGLTRGRKRPAIGRRTMKISARNILAGEVTAVTRGAVNAEVRIAVISGGSIITSIITNASADALGLAAGKAAYAVIKASEVMIGKGLETARLSARN